MKDLDIQITDRTLRNNQEVLKILGPFLAKTLTQLDSIDSQTQTPEMLLDYLEKLIESGKLEYSQPASAQVLRNLVKSVRAHIKCYRQVSS